jgi:undecaprenyl-diphosphatase
VTARLSLYRSRFLAWDLAWCLRCNRTSQSRWVKRMFCVVSRLGDGMFWYAVMLGILLIEGREGIFPCLHMLAVGISSLGTYKLIKTSASRPRPFEVSQAIAPGMPPLDRFSFPSGHTLHAVAFTGVALVYYPVLACLLLPFTLLVGVSRVILGLHYPSDVLAGAVIGASIAGISFMA